MPFLNKHSWEQARMIAHIVAQANSKNIIKPTDIRFFAWDKQEEKQEQRLTEQEIERLKERGRKIKEQWQT